MVVVQVNKVIQYKWIFTKMHLVSIIKGNEVYNSFWRYIKARTVIFS